MPRKRITEEDLLDFRRRAGELSVEVGEKYEALEKARKAAEEPEEREMGILILRHSDVDMEKVRLFAENADKKGFAVEVVDLEKQPDLTGKPRKYVPEWEREMDEAQNGYVMLTGHARRIVVFGSGDAAPMATLIAEQYPVDALIVLGSGPAARALTTKRTVAKLASVARNNLFSIVCPVYCITPDVETTFKPGSASLYHDSTRSDDVQLETVSGMSVSGMWTDCEHELESRIFDYLNQL